tara:strand:+ start:411 stop:659 length:249 start_codon:yes stop_codon:yes gene_type:complete
MFQNKEDIKNKIIYRAQYRGTKEMDILMSKFVKSIINNLNRDDLDNLDKLVNLNDEKLISIRNKIPDDTLDFITKKFIEFKI